MCRIDDVSKSEKYAFLPVMSPLEVMRLAFHSHWRNAVSVFELMKYHIVALFIESYFMALSILAYMRVLYQYHTYYGIQ